MLELDHIGLGDLHAADLQNCLCEFDKMERVRLGQGKLTGASCLIDRNQINI